MSERWLERLADLDELAPPDGLADRRKSFDPATAGGRLEAGGHRRGVWLAAIVGVAVALVAGGVTLARHYQHGGPIAANRGFGFTGPVLGHGQSGFQQGAMSRSAGAELLGVAASGPNDVWAVGSSWTKQTMLRQPSLLEHWNGTTWRSFHCPNIGELRAVTVPAPADVWAVDGGGLVHWQDGRCAQIPRLPVRGEISLSSVAATAPNQIWVSGEQPGRHFRADNFTGWNTLIARWDGSTWHVYKTPNRSSRDNYLSGIVATSPTKVWAGGYSQTFHGIPLTLVLHWNGRTWHVERTPDPSQNYNVIWGMGTDTEHVWALGDSGTGRPPNGGKEIGLLLRRSGEGWQTTAPPSDHHYFDAAALSGTSPNDAWAVGGWPNGPTTIVHFDGHRWTTNAATDTKVAAHSTLAGVTALSPTDAWAVGVYNAPGTKPIVAHWDGQRWRFTILPVAKS